MCSVIKKERRNCSRKVHRTENIRLLDFFLGGGGGGGGLFLN